MPLDPYYRQLFAALAEVDLARLDDERVSARVIELVERKPSWPMPDVAVAQRSIPGPHGPVPLRLYRPPGELRGALVWAHGGGFTGGDLDMREAQMVSAELAHRSDCLVASVGYRLAVDGVRYPIPLDDVSAAWRWVVGSFPDLPVSVGGASAGGALAMATAMRARDAAKPAASLLLAYPFVHRHFPAPTGDLQEVIKDLPDPARLPQEYVAGMVADYVGGNDVPVEAMPGHGDLAGLPPATLVVPEFDGLRPSAELLQDQLRRAAVPVRTFLAVGMLHGHLNLACSIDAVDQSLAFLAEGLRSAR
jgi:acetyl esterase